MQLQRLLKTQQRPHTLPCPFDFRKLVFQYPYSPIAQCLPNSPAQKHFCYYLHKQAMLVESDTDVGNVVTFIMLAAF